MERTIKTKSNLFYIFHGRFPSEKAASLFAAKEVESFGRLGREVVLLVPRRLGIKKEDIFSYYSLEKTFRVVYLPTLDLFSVPFLKKWAFLISHAFFGISCLVYLLFNSERKDKIVSNETIALIFVSLIRSSTLYELHDFPEKNLWMYKLLFDRVGKILITNKWKRDKFHKIFSISEHKTFVEPNAVEVQEFDVSISKEEARERLGIPQEKKIVIYTGHLYPWKGVDTLAKAAEEFSEEISVYFVGGTEHDVQVFKERFEKVRNVFIVGHKPHHEMPVWQKAADVLVLPNTSKEDISKYYTSPMKAFEYMASGRPIVASDIPSIREIAGDNTVYYAEPDEPKSFARVIELTIKSHDSAKIQAARALVEGHTWGKRANRIVKRISNT